MLIQMNEHTWTVMLCLHFCKSCELKTWICSSCGSHKSFWIIVCL